MSYVAAILYGWAVSVLMAIVLGFANHGLGPGSAVASLAAGGFVTLTAILFAVRQRRPGGPRPRGWEWFPIVLFGLFTLRAFLWLIFRDGDDLVVLSPNNLGDMSLHLTFIHYLANGAPFWPDSPIFAQGKLAYSVGTDLFNSLLVLAGMDTVRGLVWVGLVGATLSGIALWKWGRAFALLGFLCSGGLLGFACFSRAEGQPFFQDYPGLMVFDWAWKSLPLALLVTQRGFLYALPAGLLLLSSWRTRFLQDGQGWRLPIAGEVLLYAAMPVFHLHTFLALSFLLACWYVAQPGVRKKLLVLVGAAFLPATALVYCTIGMFHANATPAISDMSHVENPPKPAGTSVLGWQPGWMVNEPLEKFDPWPLLAEANPELEPWEPHGRFLLFWLGNFGILPFLVLAVAWKLLGQVRGSPLPIAWPIIGTLGFLFITPLLGQSRSYQTGSLGGWLLGGMPDSLLLTALVSGAAVLSSLGALLLYRKKIGPTWLPFILAGLALLFFLDSLCTTLHDRAGFPLLRANALPLIVATAGFFVLLVQLSRRWKSELWPVAIFFPGVYLFFVCCNVLFAPSAWDNTKLMLWAYLLVIPFVWELLVVHWRVWQRAGVLVLLFFSGFVTLIGGLHPSVSGHAIARLSEMDALRKATRDIPITETIVAAPTYNHPLLLIGRKLTLGYSAHVWSHGIDSRLQERRIDMLMEGDIDWRLQAAWLDARYLYFGTREAEIWTGETAGWKSGAEAREIPPFGTLYDLETPPLPIAE